MKTNLIIKIVLILLFSMTHNVSLAQEANTVENKSKCTTKSLPQSNDTKQCYLKQLKLTTNNREDIEHEILEKRIQQLEAQIKPLTDKISVLQVLIKRYEIEKAEYEKEVNWNLEELF
jgi:ribosome-binding protein aMBF1 (putative translation factor)